MKAFLPLLTVLLWVLCFPGLETARADGIVISERALKPLEIPGQTGVILHRDGKETLTIWNKVQSDASPMAWVLPLPSVPEVIQETDPAAVRLLQLAAAPQMKIRGRLGWEDWSFAGLVLLVGVAVLVARRPPNRGEMTARILLILCMTLILFAGWKACYGSAGPAEQLLKPADPLILAIQETGSYTTTVIQGDSISQVNGWLAANGFSPFAGDQAKAAESYVAGKWVFLCAKLKTTASGMTAVRPLTVRFASQDAVYPMSLTKGAGTVPVDLYVVGQERMEDPTGRLRRLVDADAFFRFGGRHGWRLSSALFALRYAQTNPETESGQSLGFPISVEDEVPFIPPGKDILLDGLIADPEAPISHLSGVFNPASDWADISLAPTETEIPTVRYRTRKAWMLEGVQSLSGALAVFAFLMIALFAMAIGPVGIRPGWQWSVAAFLVALVILGLGLRHNSANTVFIEESRLANAAPGSPESFTGLFDTWLRSLTKPP